MDNGVILTTQETELSSDISERVRPQVEKRLLGGSWNSKHLPLKDQKEGRRILHALLELPPVL